MFKCEKYSLLWNQPSWAWQKAIEIDSGNGGKLQPYLEGGGVGGHWGRSCPLMASAWLFQERVGVGLDSCWALSSQEMFARPFSLNLIMPQWLFFFFFFIFNRLNFQSSFRFRAKLSRRYIYPLLPTMHSLPHYKYFPPRLYLFPPRLYFC